MKRATGDDLGGSPSMVDGAQRSLVAGLRVELDLDRPRLIVVDGESEFIVQLVSPVQIGIAVHLLHARRTTEKGYCAATEILAYGYGFAKTRNPLSVGKRIAELNKEPGFRRILEITDGVTTGPWRIHVPPDRILVRHEDQFQALARSRRERPVADEPGVAGTRDQERDLRIRLHEVEELIHRCADTGRSRDRVRAVLKAGRASRDDSSRARAARVEAMFLRRSGKLTRATRSAVEALELQLKQAAPDPLELAGSLHELASVFYLLGKPDDALTLSRAEHSLLCRLAPEARRQALARCLRACARAELARGSIDAALRAARAAAEITEADNDAGHWLARALKQYASILLPGNDHKMPAVRHLERIATMVPAVDPASVILVRRLLAEALYEVEDVDAADMLALGVIRDARDMDSALDLDATLRLLRRHERRDVLDTIPAHERGVERDALTRASIRSEVLGRSSASDKRGGQHPDPDRVLELVARLVETPDSDTHNASESTADRLARRVLDASKVPDGPPLPSL